MSKKKTTEAKDIHVSGDFIAGDQYNYYYTGDFASLAEYYISPEPVFQRVRTDDFIGRDWLTAKVDAFLNDPTRKSGAFLLIGDAGVGKTSFMAHLVKERRYLHLFAEQAPGQAMLQRAMQSLGSQLVTRYQIDPYKDRDTLNALSVFPDFLERILRLAASTLTEGEKIVIVCDALDEAGTFPDHFVFGLPKELPDGVYFILSQRPVNVKLPNFEPVIEKLEAQGEGNLQDIESYLSAVAKRPEVAGQIRSKEYSEDFFIQTLKEKSQGVWMYLHYIIKEIESGARAPLDLVNLPTGLVGYYAEYWDAWRTGKRGKGEEAWDELYAPLLTTLAAAQEAIPVDWLIQWADMTAKPREVTRLLTEHWRAFITEKEKDGQKTYAPYHLSFREFITGRVDTTKLPPTQANLVKDLASQTADAHKRIVSAFEKECNGEWEKLVEQDYPRLHLTAHLNGAGEYEKLRVMLTEGEEKIKWAEAKEQKEETYVGYLNDLRYIWDYAEREQNYALAIRCMLIENGIHSLIDSIPPELLAKLALAGIWSYTKCFSVIREKSQAKSQAEAWLLLVQKLPEVFVQEAFAASLKIKNQDVQGYLIASLAPYLTKDLIEKGLSIVHNFKEEYNQAKVLISFILHGDNQIKRQIFILLQETKSKSFQAQVLLNIIPQTITDYQTQILRIAHELKDRKARADIFFALAQQFQGKLRKQFLNSTLFEISKLDINDYHRRNMLLELLPYLSGVKKAEVREELLIKARKNAHLGERTESVMSLISYFGKKDQLQIVDEEFELVIGSIFGSRRVVGMAPLISYLNRQQKARALKKIFELKDQKWKFEALITFMPYLKGEIKNHTIKESLLIAHEAQNLHWLLSLIPFLDKTLKKKVLQEVLAQSKEEWGYKNNLKLLLPYLDNKLKRKIIQEVLAQSKEEWDYKNNLKLLLPYLDIKTMSMVYEDFLERMSKAQYRWRYSEILSFITTYIFDEESINQALDGAMGIKNRVDRIDALLVLMPFLNSKIKLKLLRTIGDTLVKKGDVDAQMLDLFETKIFNSFNNTSMSKSKETLRDVLLQKEMPHVMIEIYLYFNGDIDSSPLEDTMSRWKEFEYQHFDQLFIRILKYVSLKGRSEGQEITLALTPALVHFRGPEIVPELFRAIQDTARWWP